MRSLWERASGARKNAARKPPPGICSRHRGGRTPHTPKGFGNPGLQLCQEVSVVSSHLACGVLLQRPRTRIQVSQAGLLLAPLLLGQEDSVATSPGQSP